MSIGKVREAMTKGHAEIEEKCRLPDELAGTIMHLLDAGMKLEIPGWGYAVIRSLGVKRIIDRYYDTPDRMFQVWSKVYGKWLLLRDRSEGTITSKVDPRNIQTLEDIIRLPITAEMHRWVAKVPLAGVGSNSRRRQAREYEALYTEQDKEAVKLNYLI